MGRERWVSAKALGIGPRVSDSRIVERGTRVGMTIRVLLVDDEHMVREGFRLILETQSDIRVVGEAEDGRSAVEAATRLTPDVVLMDIRMRGMDGLEATRIILARLVQPPKEVMLTTID